MKKILITFLITVVVTSFSHKPIFEEKNSTFEKPIFIDNHKISYAVYGFLESSQDIDFIYFKAKTGENIFVQMTVPIIRGNECFSPTFALISKTINQRESIPFELSEEYGVIVVPPTTEKKYFLEHFTGTEYYIRQTIEFTVTQDGDFFVAVYGNEKGKYVLAVGKIESFGILDILSIPLTIYKLNRYFKPDF